MAYSESDFQPVLIDKYNQCGCEHHGYLCPCHIYFVDSQKVCHHVCFRMQCPECGFLVKNKIGKVMYYDIVDSGSRYDRFTFLPEYFWAPEDYCFDANKQYSKKMKLDFIRRILTLANQESSHFGHLYFTREQIDSVKFA